MFGFCQLCPHLSSESGCVFPSKGDREGRILELGQRELEPNQLLNTVTGDTHIAFIREGWAFSFRTKESGGRTVGGLYTKGDTLGLPHFFARDLRYSARAMSGLKICMISVDEFTRHVRSQDNYFEYFQREGWRLLWKLSSQTYDLTHRSAEERLCRAFILVGLSMHGAAKNYYEAIPVTQEILADLIGTSKVHINRLLVKLKRDGICHASHGYMTVLDWEKLMQRGGASNSDVNAWVRVMDAKTVKADGQEIGAGYPLS